MLFSFSFMGTFLSCLGSQCAAVLQNLQSNLLGRPGGCVRAGLLEHHVITNHLVKGEPVRTQMFDEPGPTTRPCYLTVQSRQQVRLNPVAAAAFGLEEAWESEVELGTGRTHQVC